MRDYRCTTGDWDEMVDATGQAPPACAGVVEYLASLGEEVHERQRATDLAIRTMGITFTVYSDAGNIDRAWPFDVIPRVISTPERSPSTAGLSPRLTALYLLC